MATHTRCNNKPFAFILLLLSFWSLPFGFEVLCSLIMDHYRDYTTNDTSSYLNAILAHMNDYVATDDRRRHHANRINICCDVVDCGTGARLADDGKWTWWGSLAFHCLSIWLTCYCNTVTSYCIQTHNIITATATAAATTTAPAIRFPCLWFVLFATNTWRIKSCILFHYWCLQCIDGIDTVG